MTTVWRRVVQSAWHLAAWRGAGLVAAGLLAAGQVGAAPSFDCRRASTAAERAICADPEAAQLDSDLAQAYRQAQAALAHDPSAVAALQAEQRRFIALRDQHLDNPAFQLLRHLHRRLELLRSIDPQPRRGLAGRWAALQGEVAVRQAGGSWEVMAWAAEPGIQSWTCGEPGEFAAAQVQGAGLRSGDWGLAREGAVLRVSGRPGAAADAACPREGSLAGVYFPVRAAAATSAAAAVVPSFDCRQARTDTERAICADPALARQDADIAQAYRRALAALASDPAAQQALRLQQQAYLVQRDDDTLGYLEIRQGRQLAFLKDIHGAPRKGVRGAWVAHEGELVVRPVPGQPGIEVSAETLEGSPPSFRGCNWESADYREQAGVARSEAVNGWVLWLRRQGMLLRVDEQPPAPVAGEPVPGKGYCARGGGLARLYFPARPAAKERP